MPKQGTFFFSLSFEIYLASFVSTIVYKIIEFCNSVHSLMILSICCSVLTKANSFFYTRNLQTVIVKIKNPI